MRSSTVFASVLAFAASTLAQTAGYAVVSAPGDGETVPAGKTYTIQWSAGKYTGPATISLLGGETDTTLEVLGSLGSVQVEKESFSWAVECSLGEDKTYGIKIADEASNGATFQYSFPFEIKGPSCGSTSSSSSVSASATTSASGYPVETPSSSSTVVTTSSSSSSVVSTSTVSHNSTSSAATSSYPVPTSTSVKSTTKVHTTAISTFSTSATPTTYVVVTQTPTGASSSSAVPTTSASVTPVPTAGAARVGAGLALGLMAAALAL
ncbi:Ser-Thr-rich glycosyl-phosphatidyl-inositol-anchored membrane family-domain-containing protein [Xylaria arbuscula]|nr:Ser-Thr-rich glycosyl-phosphatidyl-inositol-anchored membrane family-domain-containing protein [Xylaria arbuscula]